MTIAITNEPAEPEPAERVTLASVRCLLQMAGFFAFIGGTSCYLLST